jgi:hypothetical protein
LTKLTGVVAGRGKKGEGGVGVGRGGGGGKKSTKVDEANAGIKLVQKRES